LVTRRCSGNVLLREPRFEVQAAILDHGIPSLGFALEETVQINVWRNKVEALGLSIGPWLRNLKEAAARGDADENLIAVERHEPGSAAPMALPLGDLKREVLQFKPGRKIVYVVDTAFTRPNAEKIIALASNADVLFIEAPFLQVDAHHAAARRHLTAHQAGWLAREAQVKRLVTLHYSPRYQGRGDELEREALAAFVELIDLHPILIETSHGDGDAGACAPPSPSRQYLQRLCQSLAADQNR
jgi:ribonuclease Z